MEDNSNFVGLVIGTVSSTPLEFWVGVSDRKYLELDDVVYMETQVDGLDEVKSENNIVRFYGIINQVEKAFEGVEFHSDNLLVEEGILPTSISYIGKVLVTRVEPEIFVPPQPGNKVYRAKGKELDNALYFEKMDKRVVAGYMRNREAAYINYDFINGEKGAHISISGISGVATKTSYALFLLHSILNSQSIPGDERANTRAIVFNVKGEDLLFLDKYNSRLKEEQIEIYKRLNLPSEPFSQVKFYTSPKPGTKNSLFPNTDQRVDGIIPYLWTMREFAEKRLFYLLFSESQDNDGNLAYAIQHIQNKLYELAINSEKGRLTGFHGEDILSLEDVKIQLNEELENEEKSNLQWFKKSIHVETRWALVRRFESALHHVNPFIKTYIDGIEPEKHRINWNDKGTKITVVDINKLHSKAKMFVVGAVLKDIFEKKEKSGSKPTVFILLDELNKYAPRSGYSPIKSDILDIAERGRSLGLILIGAQQTASEVERRIVSNASIRITGRLDTAEAIHHEYNYLTGSFKQRASIIKPGTMIMHQPELPTPLLINFPFAAWATRSSETDDNKEEDLFKRFE